MLALVCRTILVTHALICGPVMNEQEAKDYYLSQWRPVWLNANASESEPFIVREIDQGWAEAMKHRQMHP